MLYSIKNIEELENLNELVSLQKQVNEVRLQDKLREPNYHQKTNKFFEPITDAIKDTSQNLTKFITETYTKNNKQSENLNERVLELMNGNGLIAPYLACPLVNLLKPGNKIQFRFLKDHNSTKMNDFLTQENIPVILFSKKLNFRDSNKSFELDGEFFKMMTIYKFNVDHSNSNSKNKS